MKFSNGLIVYEDLFIGINDMDVTKSKLSLIGFLMLGF